MRFAKTSGVCGLVVLLLLVSGVPSALAAAGPENSISGRLIFQTPGYSCSPCSVSLMAAPFQIVATTFVDGAGNFTFGPLNPGTYIIHADIDGFQPVDQQVTVGQFGSEGFTTLMLSPKPASKKESTGAAKVDISEFLDRYPKKAVDLYKKGLDNKEKGKADTAQKDFEQAVQMAPNFYSAHEQLALAYQRAGRTADAEKEFVQAHELNKTDVEPLVNLTSLYIDENKPDQALATGEEAVKTNSSSGPAFLTLGMALYKAAQLERAEQALKKALDLAPRLFQARLMLANVYLRQQRYNNVVEQLDRYLADNPNGEQRPAAEQMKNAILKAQTEANALNSTQNP